MGVGKETAAFLVHLRLHYQFFILPGAFLCGTAFAGGPQGWSFAAQFLNVHILLFGGATAYNSYWDRDEGPIGGLPSPPPLPGWALPASWIAQFAGLALCFRISAVSAAVYGLAMLFFWLYSRPGLRWKGRPWLSLVAIGISTGLCGFLLGYLHGGFLNGGNFLSAASAIAVSAGAAGTTFLILSLYPISQVYQVEEDLGRKDLTFTAKYGLRGMRRAYAWLYFPGLALLSAALGAGTPALGLSLFCLGVPAGLGIWRQVRTLGFSPAEYGKVMRIKYAASGLFAFFLVGVLAWQALG